MRALAVLPGHRGSSHLREIPSPRPGGGEVLVKTLLVGVCGTDAEIDQGLYGEAPPDSEFLLLGHEALGQVAELGEGVLELRPGDYVVPTVRRPDACLNCQAGEPDMCLSGGYRERGIKGGHGFAAECFTERTEHLIKLPTSLGEVGVLAEPLSIVEKAVSQAYRIQERMVWRPQRALVLGAGPIGLLATALLRLRGLRTYTLATSPRDSLKAQLAEAMGARYVEAASHPIPTLGEELENLDLIIEATGSSIVAFQAMSILGINGVLCLTGVSAGHRHLQIHSDALNLGMVLGNKTVFGSVNANRQDWTRGVRHLKEIQRRWPGLLPQMITRRLPLSAFREAFSRRPQDIKTVLDPLE